MISAIQRLNQGLLAAFLIIGLALGYWGIVRREALVARADNPRRVLDEQRIQRGQILDRQGEVLAENRIDPETGLVTRIYSHPEAAPVTGYYSLTYGVGGIEAEFDDLLRGNTVLRPREVFMNQVLHRPQVGGDVRLTIDLSLQQTAVEALADEKGAVVLLSVPDGEVLAMVSQPSFDPTILDETWDRLTEDPDAPLLNRITQGQYQPGTILQSVLLAESLNVGIEAPDLAWTGEPAVEIEGAALLCSGDPPRIDNLADAFVWGCPAPFEPLAAEMGTERFELALRDFRLLQAPVFTLPTEPAEEITVQTADLALAAYGQGDLTVSPLQMALVAASFANHGQMPTLQIVESVRQPDGDWAGVPAPGNPLGTISPAHSDQVAELMSRAALEGGAQAAAIAGQEVSGHAGLAIAGPEGSINGWFIGFVTLRDGSALAIAVLVEDVKDVTAPARIGGQVLEAGINQP